MLREDFLSDYQLTASGLARRLDVASIKTLNVA
jgi:plasmid maintenance system antidote protein VapI